MKRNKKKNNKPERGQIQTPINKNAKSSSECQTEEREESARLIRESMNFFNPGPAAEGLIRKIIKTDKDTLDALLMLGQKEGEKGRYAEAEALIRQALRINQASPVTFNNLGCLLLNLGKPDKAVESYLKALELNPDFAEVHLNLGKAFQKQGALSEAVKSYQHTIELKPDSFEAFLRLGDVFREIGAFSEAERNCRKAVELNPDFAEAYRSLGDILLENENLPEAIEAYQRAVELKPDFDAAYRHLGRALCKQAAGSEARKNLEMDGELTKDAEEFCSNLGLVLKEHGALTEEIENCLKVVELKPDFAMAHNRLGGALRNEGRISEASDCFLRAIKLKPDYALAHSNYVSCRKFTVEDHDYADGLEVLLDKAETAEDRLNLHFALGKIYDECKKYDEAFEHYAAFNKLERKKYTYHREYFSSYVDRLIRVFPEGFYRSRSWKGVDSDRPVFILGMPRSGTTLVEQIISSHPLVHGAGELECLSEMGLKLKERYNIPYPECLKSIPSDELQKQAEFYLDILQGLSGSSLRVIDKMPQNFLYIGFISLLLSRPKIIHCRRDPLDTCLSIFFQKFLTGGHPYSYDLFELGHYYLDYERLMAHWRKVLPHGMMLEIQYEEVVERPEEMSRNLITFCGLNWEDRCLKFNENLRAVKTSSFWQVRQPLYKTSRERWRNYERFLDPLRRVLEGKRS
jgi:tetratricopeptide (TPR) repeat protein